MGTEIERKYLVTNDQWRREAISETRIQQGYLANQNNASIRVRIAGDKASLNIKAMVIGVKRSDFEYEIPLDDARVLLEDFAEKPYIEKTRYEVRVGAHIWELDVFSGENQGLIVAEIELGSEYETFELPHWAGLEVSDDERYYNVSLVKRPFSRW